MTTGLSGSFAFNDVNLVLQPSETKWVERTSYGIDGSGHNIYSNFRNYEMSWDLISASEVKQLIDFFNVVTSPTGSVVACLPQYGNTNYQFYNYSGTTMGEVSTDTYFQGYTQNVRLLLLNIRTN